MCYFYWFLKSQDVRRCHQLFALYVLYFLTRGVICFHYTFTYTYIYRKGNCKTIPFVFQSVHFAKVTLGTPRTVDIWVCLNQVNQEDCYSSYLRQEGDPPGLDIIRWRVCLGGRSRQHQTRVTRLPYDVMCAIVVPTYQVVQNSSYQQ